MSCVDLSVSIHRKIRRIVLPTLVGAMTLVSAVAVILGWETLGAHLGGEHWGTMVSEYFWITFWIAVAALFALLVGLIVVWRLSCGIASPIAELANRADALTERGGTAHFPESMRICEIDRLAKSFNRLFALQEQQAFELRDLIQNVLHDIRAPLSHISQQAECIYDGSGDPSEAAGLITESCDKIIRLFETHAEIARNNAAAESAPASRQDLTEVVRFMLDLYQPVAEMNGVRLSLDRIPDPIFLNGHRNKLERLVGNLIDNAIKFTPPGGSVTVSATCREADIEFRVSDTGIGIASECLPHIFDRYFRSKTAAGHSGCGLGLTLVQSIVTFYHGSIDCQSTPGHGTVFTVHLKSLT